MSKASEYAKAWYHHKAQDPSWRAARTARASAWKRANPEKVKAAKKRWREANPERAKYAEKMRLFKSNYALTKERFEALWTAQGGKCAICDRELEKLGRQTHVDHCHAQGHVRGILCEWCNHGLGYVEKPGYLDRALAHLERTRMLKSDHVGFADDSICAARPERDSPSGARD